MEYQLELKQIVDFQRCRIYRNFIQTLLNDRSIRTTGASFLVSGSLQIGRAHV